MESERERQTTIGQPRSAVTGTGSTSQEILTERVGTLLHLPSTLTLKTYISLCSLRKYENTKRTSTRILLQTKQTYRMGQISSDFDKIFTFCYELRYPEIKFPSVKLPP